MPHIELHNDLPGIRGLLAERPDTAAPLNLLADTLLRAPATLPAGERELIAAYVSERNTTRFCSGTHGAAAAAQLDDGRAVVEAVLTDVETAPVNDRLRALLRIAAQVQEQAQPVSDEAVAAARAAGADDAAIHDTVLIAAAFCMYNRYVSCLDTAIPDPDSGYYDAAARRIVGHGYAGNSAPVPG